MRVLISPIGKQDPLSGQTGKYGAAISTCLEVEPRRVYLLPTKARPDIPNHSNTEPEADETRAWLASLLPAASVEVRPLDLVDPSDYAGVLPEVERVVRQVLDELEAEGPTELYVNTTSATPQIKAACLVLVATGFLPARALQVANPRTQTRPERVQEVDVTFLRERQLIDGIDAFVRRHLFAAAATQLREIARLAFSPARRRVAEAHARLCAGYVALDRFQFAVAAARLTEARPGVGAGMVPIDVAALLDEQVAVAATLARATPADNGRVLAELYHNAERRIAEENYVDALSRGWTLIEQCQRHVLGRDHNFAPGYREFQAMAADLEKRRDAVYTRWLAQPEAGSGKPIGLLLPDLREARNASIAAHGVRPVVEGQARLGLRAAGALVKAVFGDVIATHPFSGAALDRVHEALLAALRRG